MQFGVFLVRGFQMRFSPSRFYYEVNVIERSARQNPFEYKLQTSIGGLSTSPPGCKAVLTFITMILKRIKEQVQEHIPMVTKRFEEE
jgi:hypothetical protein